MKTIEWMPFLGDRFWESESVARMDDAAIGLYVWLLWRQFKHGSLPDAAQIPPILPRSGWRRRWSKLWPQIEPCFVRGEDGRWRNPLCAEKSAEADRRIRIARSNGHLGGRPKKPEANRPVSETEPPGSGSGKPPGSGNGHVPETQVKAQNGTEQNSKTLPSEVPRAARSVSKRTERGKVHQAFIDWWCTTFREVCGSAYGFDHDKDAAQVKVILNLAGESLETAKNRALILLHAAPGWIDEGGRDLCTLRSQWNRLASMGTGRTSGSKQLAIHEAAGVPPSSGLLDMPTARRT